MKSAIVLATALLASYSSVAQAATTPLYVAAHYHTHKPIPPDKQGDFLAIVGYPDQQVAGTPFWQYVKGSRSPIASFPERWYVHFKGVRVHDRRYGYYVMNPNRQGWQRYVAAECAGRCFLDGIGTTSLHRTLPRISWTAAEWVRAASALIAYVHAHGSAVLPNSISTGTRLEREYLNASGGRGSAEGGVGATLLNLGRIWVQADGGDCLARWHAFETETDGNDHFSCHPTGSPPWDDSWYFKEVG